MALLKNKAKELLSLADIKIDGDRPWDIQVHDDRLYARVFSQGSLGLGEAYMDGWWDAEKLDLFFEKILGANLDHKIAYNPVMLWDVAVSTLFNLQSRSRAFQIGEKHYDIGNDLYKAMLDKRMAYTCGYWENASTLDQAQEAKLDLVCRKLGLKPGMKVLDIGCGWGSFLKYAAEKYGVRGVGVTVAKEQVQLAKELCEGLPVEILLQDYREVKGMFDRIVSLGMIEHVGSKNYRTFMEMARRSLKEDGLFLLHTIGGLRSLTFGDPWIVKYIFPNSMIPSAEQLLKAAKGLFVMEDWHNFGYDYYPTLMAWMRNVDDNWDELKGTYDKRFYRMWRYFLLSVSGAFKTRKNQLWQIVFSKHGVQEGYQSIR